jgi:hypothetical protein
VSDDEEARRVNRAARAWWRVAVGGGKPESGAEQSLVTAAGLFDQAARLAGRAEDLAWRGICRTEFADPDWAVIGTDLAAAKGVRGGTDDPAVVILDGLLAVSRVQPTRKSQVDVRDVVAALTLAESKYQQTLRAVEARRSKDQPVRSEEVALAARLGVLAAVDLANFDRSDPSARSRWLEAAGHGAAVLEREAPEGVDGLYARGYLIEHRAWLLKPPDRLTPAGGYAEADRLYTTGLDRTGRKSDGLIHAGRNLFRWAEDKFHCRKAGESLDEALLGRAEKCLMDAAAEVTPNPRSAALAECHFWLAQTAMFRHTAGLGDPAASYRRAVSKYEAALQSALTRNGLGWYERVLLGLASAHVAEGFRLAAQGKDPSDPLAALDLTARRADAWPLSIPRKAHFAVLAHQVRGTQARPVLADLLKAAEPGLSGLTKLTQDREVQVQLRLILAEIQSKQMGQHPVALAAAVKEAQAAVVLADTTPDFPAESKARAHETLGRLVWADWAADPKKKPVSLLTEAQTRFGRAVAEDPGPNSWRARMYLGLIEEATAKSGTRAEAASASVRAVNFFREAEARLDELRGWTSAPQPDEKGFLDGRDELYGRLRDTLRAALGMFSQPPERPAWELAAAELEYALAGGKPVRLSFSPQSLSAAKKAVRRITDPDLRVAGMAIAGRLERVIGKPDD